MSDAPSKPAEPMLLAPYNFQAYAGGLLGKEVRVLKLDGLHSVTGSLMGVDAFSLLIGQRVDKSKLTVIPLHALSQLDLA